MFRRWCNESKEPVCGSVIEIGYLANELSQGIVMSKPALTHTESHAFAASKSIQALTFVVNREVYGINILNIIEIIAHGTITKVPMMPEFISGVINLRGNVVPVVSLALRFAQKSSTKTKRTSIVILGIEHEEQPLEVGIIVDEVHEVIEIDTQNIEAAPSFGTKIRSDFISGICRKFNRNSENRIALRSK